MNDMAGYYKISKVEKNDNSISGNAINACIACRGIVDTQGFGGENNLCTSCYEILKSKELAENFRNLLKKENNKK